jgi:hypothetical protein
MRAASSCPTTRGGGRFRPHRRPDAHKGFILDGSAHGAAGFALDRMLREKGLKLDAVIG